MWLNLHLDVCWIKRDDGQWTDGWVWKIIHPHSRQNWSLNYLLFLVCSVYFLFQLVSFESHWRSRRVPRLYTSLFYYYKVCSRTKNYWRKNDEKCNIFMCFEETNIEYPLTCLVEFSVRCRRHFLAFVEGCSNEPRRHRRSCIMHSRRCSSRCDNNNFSLFCHWLNGFATHLSCQRRFWLHNFIINK